MKRSGSLDVEILRTRAAIKAWAIRQIALTPASSVLEKESSDWFHDLPVAERSRMFTDLARLTLEGADLRDIANGPLGDLLRRYSSLFKVAEVVESKVTETQEDRELVAVTMADAIEPSETDNWEAFDRSFKQDDWDQN